MPALEVLYSHGQLDLKGEDFLLIREAEPLPSSSALPHVRTSLDSAQEAEPDVRPRGPAAEPQPQASSSGRHPGTYGLFCVFDGHNGSAAASHTREAFAQALYERMPDGPMPERASKHWQPWCEGLQSALVGAFAEVHEAYACCGTPAGCTATAVVQTGSLLTVANLGDSRACLDTGKAVAQLTVDHRVATHKGERRRLQAQKVHIAPIGLDGDGPAKGPDSEGFGPLRMWPGGLCLSRAIGDYDVGTNVLCAPHIQQVWLPDNGSRLLIGSDGVWDAFDTNSRICKMVRGLPPQAAQEKVLRTIKQMHGGVRDDATLIVADLTPADLPFPQLCQNNGLMRTLASKGSGFTTKGSGLTSNGSGFSAKSTGSSRGGGCFCMSGSATVDDDEPAAGPVPSAKPVPSASRRVPGEALILADLDVAACAGLLEESDSASLRPAWLDESWAADIRSIQDAAVEAWQVASTRKGRGEAMSREDLAGYFARAHSRPVHKPRAQPTSPDDYTVKFGARPSQELQAPEELERESASQHYKDAVASEGSYGQKFGHYQGDTISTTPEPSRRPDQAVDGQEVMPQAAAPQTPAPQAEAKPERKPKDKGRRVHVVEVQR